MHRKAKNAIFSKRTRHFLIYAYGIMSGTMKAIDRNRIDTFETWYWRRRNNLESLPSQHIYPQGTGYGYSKSPIIPTSL